MSRVWPWNSTVFCVICTNLHILHISINQYSLNVFSQWNQTFCQVFLHVYVNMILSLTLHDPIKMVIFHFDEYGWNAGKACASSWFPFFSKLKPVNVQFGSQMQLAWLSMRWDDVGGTMNTMIFDTVDFLKYERIYIKIQKTSSCWIQSPPLPQFTHRHCKVGLAISRKIMSRSWKNFFFLFSIVTSGVECYIYYFS